MGPIRRMRTVVEVGDGLGLPCVSQPQRNPPTPFGKPNDTLTVGISISMTKIVPTRSSRGAGPLKQFLSLQSLAFLNSAEAGGVATQPGHYLCVCACV